MDHGVASFVLSLHPVKRREWVTPLLVTELLRRFQKKRAQHFLGSAASVISHRWDEDGMSEVRRAPFSVMQAITCTVKEQLFRKTKAGFMVAVTEVW
jgi:hypothetical protein